jgi:phosphate transport system substrate-binding protein
MVSRSLYDSERDLTAHTIAIDGITMIVHKTNPIASLSRQQIIDIYTGKLKNWSDVGAFKGRIVVENKAEGRSTLDLFVEYFKLKAEEIRADVIVGDNEQAIKVVAGNSAAIGYVSVGGAVYAADSGVPIKPLALEGIQPTIAAVAARKFPIVRELNLVVTSEPSPLARDFISFAGSERVDDLVRDLFYVPIR